jgi:hypothetical protein
MVSVPFPNPGQNRREAFGERERRQFPPTATEDNHVSRRKRQHHYRLLTVALPSIGSYLTSKTTSTTRSDCELSSGDFFSMSRARSSP